MVWAIFSRNIVYYLLPSFVAKATAASVPSENKPANAGKFLCGERLFPPGHRSDANGAAVRMFLFSQPCRITASSVWLCDAQIS